MKKTIFSLMFAMMFGMALVSCDKSAKTTETEQVADTTVVDTTVVDTLVEEAVEAVEEEVADTVAEESEKVEG